VGGNLIENNIGIRAGARLTAARHGFVGHLFSTDYTSCTVSLPSLETRGAAEMVSCQLRKTAPPLSALAVMFKSMCVLYLPSKTLQTIATQQTYLLLTVHQKSLSIPIEVGCNTEID
jgi:hypothetical protein